MEKSRETDAGQEPGTRAPWVTPKLEEVSMRDAAGAPTPSIGTDAYFPTYS